MLQERFRLDPQAMMIERRRELDRRRWRLLAQGAVIVLLAAIAGCAWLVEPLRPTFDALGFDLPRLTLAGLALSAAVTGYWWAFALGGVGVSTMIWLRRLDPALPPVTVVVLFGALSAVVLTWSPVQTHSQIAVAFEHFDLLR